MKELNVRTNWTPADLALFRDALDKLIQLTPFRTNLDEDERRTNQTVADARLPFVKDCHDIAINHRVALNMTLDELQELQTVYQDFVWVDLFLQELDTFRTGFSDARHLLGANCLTLSRQVHDAVKLAAKKGKPGMRALQRILDERNAQHGNGKKKKGDKDNNGGPNDQPIPGAGPQDDNV